MSGEQWQWARSENGRTNWINIAGETSSSYTPTEDDEDFYLRARVEYTDNRGTGKSAEGVTTGPIPSENRRPTFPDTETGDRTVDENTRARVNIGAPVAAVDPENNRLTYSLTGTDADAFTIVAGTGQLRTKDPLDYETKDSYSVTVNVHDGRDGSGATSTDIDNTQDVTITVENVEEAGYGDPHDGGGKHLRARGSDRGAHRPGRQRQRRHLAVVAVAERQDRLGQHWGG